ncbi:MAG: glycoside hydrolase family 2, partial [Chloroflexi bacterium]|nr:glycoside hydrolase family 2 [Chloroflexota bacterium]
MTSITITSAPQLPRPEHPNPIFQRPHWLSLNGSWDFAFDPHNQGEHAHWWHHPSPVPFERQITVPFPWESPLSGICSPSYRGAAWYRRTISIPPPS